MLAGWVKYKYRTGHNWHCFPGFVKKLKSHYYYYGLFFNQQLRIVQVSPVQVLSPLNDLFTPRSWGRNVAG